MNMAFRVTEDRHRRRQASWKTALNDDDGRLRWPWKSIRHNGPDDVVSHWCEFLTIAEKTTDTAGRPSDATSSRLPADAAAWTSSIFNLWIHFVASLSVKVDVSRRSQPAGDVRSCDTRRCQTTERVVSV